MSELINIADLKDPSDQQGRTYREINQAKHHKFGIGLLVELENGCRLRIAKRTRDCDGTPLYSLTATTASYITPTLLHGYAEDGMQLASDTDNPRV